MSKITEFFNKLGYFLIAILCFIGFAAYNIFPILWNFIKFCLEIIGMIFVIIVEAFFEIMKTILDW